MRIQTTVRINRPIDAVFAYVTTPGHWPEWHPASRAVRGGVDHSLEPGEQVTEDYQVAGLPGTAVWTVRERQAPTRWVIDGEGDGGQKARITYTLTAEGGATVFHRDLEVDADGLEDGMPAEWLAQIEKHVEAESAEALRRLKALLEAPPH